jgi:CheY-like chemotaxis protein
MKTNMKIAWIEDDIGIIEDVIQPLINDGYKFTYLRSIGDALDNIDLLKTVDLILLDLIFPTGDETIDFNQYPGVSLLERLKNEFKIQTPVIAFTVVTNGQAHKQLRELGVVEIINKPVRPSELRETVNQVLTG